MITRYNMFPAAPINGALAARASAPATSSATMETLAGQELPRSR